MIKLVDFNLTCAFQLETGDLSAVSSKIQRSVFILEVTAFNVVPACHAALAVCSSSRHLEIASSASCYHCPALLALPNSAFWAGATA